MNIVVTGAAGQVGQSLLQAAPAHVSCIGLNRNDLDISNRSAVLARLSEFNPSVIVNAAAFTAVDQAELEPERAFAANETGASNLAEAARELDARLIHLSTDYVFNGKASEPYRPDAPTDPLGVYGASKLAGEQAVLSLLPERSVILRTAWVYSAVGRNFMLTMLRLMAERDSISVVSDQTGSPTAASSIARAILAFVEQPALHGVFHWTDAGTASWYDFAVSIAEEAVSCGLLSGPADIRPIATKDYPTRAMRPGFSVLDTTASVAALGIEPPHWRNSLHSVIGELKLA